MAWAIEQRFQQNPNQRDIFISIPCRSANSLSHKWALSFKTLNVPLTGSIAFETGQPIDISRNISCVKALQIGAKYLLFWDADVLAKPDSLEVLLSIKMPMVGAVYRSRGEPYQPLANIRTSNDKRPVSEEEIKQNENGIIKVDDVGMGFCLIDMRVIKALASKMNEWRCLQDHTKELGREIAIYDNKTAKTNNYKCELCKRTLMARFFWYRIGMQNIHALSEDYYFCHQVRSLGYPIVIVPKVFLNHETTFGEVGKEGIENSLRGADNID